MNAGWRPFLAARHTTAFVAVLVGASLVVLASGATVLDVTVDSTRPPRFTPVWEAIPVVVAVASPTLIAPRLASWEAMARTRVRLRAATVAVLSAVAPAAIPWVAHLRLPADARWWDISCNVALYGGVALIATVLVGPLGGPLVGLCAYLGVVIVQQLAPGLATALPVSGAKTNLTAHPLPSTVVVVVAVGCWYVTAGQSRLARNLRRNS